MDAPPPEWPPAASPPDVDDAPDWSGVGSGLLLVGFGLVLSLPGLVLVGAESAAAGGLLGAQAAPAADSPYRLVLFGVSVLATLLILLGRYNCGFHAPPGQGRAAIRSAVLSLTAALSWLALFVFTAPGPADGSALVVIGLVALGSLLSLAAEVNFLFFLRHMGRGVGWPGFGQLILAFVGLAVIALGAALAIGAEAAAPHGVHGAGLASHQTTSRLGAVIAAAAVAITVMYAGLVFTAFMLVPAREADDLAPASGAEGATEPPDPAAEAPSAQAYPEARLAGAFQGVAGGLLLVGWGLLILTAQSLIALTLGILAGPPRRGEVPDPLLALVPLGIQVAASLLVIVGRALCWERWRGPGRPSAGLSAAMTFLSSIGVGVVLMLALTGGRATLGPAVCGLTVVLFIAEASFLTFLHYLGGAAESGPVQQLVGTLVGLCLLAALLVVPMLAAIGNTGPRTRLDPGPQEQMARAVAAGVTVGVIAQLVYTGFLALIVFTARTAALEAEVKAKAAAEEARIAAVAALAGRAQVVGSWGTPEDEPLDEPPATSGASVDIDIDELLK